MRLRIKVYLIFLVSIFTTKICSSLTIKEIEAIGNNDHSRTHSSFTTDSELISSDEESNLTDEQTMLKSYSSSKDQSLYSNSQIIEYDDVLGNLGIIAIITNKRQTCRIISGNFNKRNETKNTLYLLFDTTNKNFVSIFVPRLIDFTLKGKQGLVTLIYNEEIFLLNKLLLINSNGEISTTNHPWKLVIEVNSDYNKLQSLPYDLRNKNYIKLPPDNWDANDDSVYPKNIKSIKPLSILTKNMNQIKELRIPHFSVGVTPTALFLKLNTGEYMSIIVPNNTVFFVDIDDCSIHSKDGHYYNICGGYAVYCNRWLFTNRPWKSRIIIQSNFEELLVITKSKLQVLENVEQLSNNSKITENFRNNIKNNKCGKCFCSRN
ncbi:unnamed protein product [Cryptosporidium hominis]|uniref:Uncharacterized protein n=1 Tax=Cryptosporidium hominis TaxID=237895 RepID=A0A0S4TES8_CRYHO|nr:hypothetical protein [Cryptosporidium hominis TU502]OLQ16630.1 hypothetical protein ChTU502y2012_384g0350 [Cryptosporidium hominis]PPA62871.1 hypothetical protein ChUKH1_14395 [Cryptosporidium hominis]PPS92487.1 Uncharacterized protein GY17_00003896 [Cryptosporidium hominis]CUV04815.1 unnamed protein product [Cryptosporidium hominis]|eukprot:PPS92487.1 Uncharacterized protein GY17_00003896 [Cryptosporidium hominis]